MQPMGPILKLGNWRIATSLESQHAAGTAGCFVAIAWLWQQQRHASKVGLDDPLLAGWH
jgi:hypothetical protein